MAGYTICDTVTPSEKAAKLVAITMSCPDCKTGSLHWLDTADAMPPGHMLHKCDACAKMYAVPGGPYPRNEVK